jgi:hypothetical protein
MGLHQESTLRWMFEMLLVWDHILPGFLVTVVHVFAHFVCLWWSLFGSEVVDLSGLAFRAAELLPIR